MSHLKPTPANTQLPVKITPYTNLVDALEYAAQGDTGFNFYDGRGNLSAVLPYADLRDEAQVIARKLLSLGCERGARVGIIAETEPMFHRFFFACQYAGLIPVAVPAGIQLGAHGAYVSQVRRMLKSCGASIVVAPDTHAKFMEEAVQGLDLLMAGTQADFDGLPEAEVEFVPLGQDDPAYLQYTSGSTSFPRGVEVTQKTVLNNLMEIARYGLKLTAEDRFVSWLPFYHDMGLVGFILVPLIGQLSVDYLGSRTFAMRPRLWLKVLSDNGGTISSAPTFGYALCAKRLRPADVEGYDLSNWRAACVGAERINPEPLEEFANILQPSGFDQNAFVACYGMAECVLATSFAPLGEGLSVDVVDKKLMAETGLAQPSDGDAVSTSAYVDCGKLLPGFEFAILDDNGVELGNRQCGHVYLKGPSVMRGYFHDKQSTAEVLSADGWLNTGDIGYRIDDHVVITSRSKDVIIIKGRNIWPYDLEVLAQQVGGVKLGGVAAFSISTGAEEEQAVLVVETKEKDVENRRQIVETISSSIHAHFGINVLIDLTPRGTLPRTSSGKLSRSQSKQDYLARKTLHDVEQSASQVGDSLTA
ncbi:MAG: fatty acyl-AMP ligase [Gammaproteobacteria bacterium]|nr:fatty acyl-AMP ligase [Gammaproteobacteria bacterium]NNL00381.1 fatty acyl-AMP ligase [Xanthomonadales bacterium]